MPGTPTMAATTEPVWPKVWAIAHQPAPAEASRPRTTNRTRPSFMFLSFLRARFANGRNSVRDDEVDAKLTQRRGRRARIARRAGGRALRPLEAVGPHAGRVDRHLQRGVRRAGMAADLGIVKALGAQGLHIGGLGDAVIV